MNYDRLFAAATPTPPAAVHGHWQAIQFKPDLTTGEVFNIGVAFTEYRKRHTHTRLLPHLNGFKALFGTVGADNFSFLLQLLREQLSAHRQLVAPGPQIVFGPKKFASGNNPHDIIDQLYSTVVTMAWATEGKEIAGADKGALQTLRLRRKIARMAVKKMGKNWPSIFREEPVAVADSNGVRHELDLPIWRGEDLVSAQIFGTILSAQFHSPIHRTASLAPGYVNFNQAAQFATKGKGGLLILRPSDQDHRFDESMRRDIDNDIDRITWPYLKQKNIHIAVGNSAEELTNAALNLA